MVVSRTLCLAALLATAAPAARADILCLVDGRIFDDVALTRIEGGLRVAFENGDVDVPSRLVQDFVIEDDSGFVPTSDEERENLAAGKVWFDGRWVTVRERDKAVEDLLEEQRALLDEIRETRVWRNRLKEESKNFSFESTVPRHVYERYRDLCEDYFAEFVKAFKIKKPRGLSKLTIKFYADEEAFYQVTGVPRGVLGFFRVIEPYELQLFYDRLDPTYTEEVLYHELGHYLHKLIDIEFRYPHWPGESMCEYYAASTFDPETKRREWGGIHSGRLTVIRAMIERDEWVGLRNMLTGCNDRNQTDYSWGWSFVHFMMKDKKNGPRFRKFFTSLALDKNVDRIIQSIGSHRLKGVSGEVMLETFSDHLRLKEGDLEEMESAWHDYIREELAIEDSRGLATAAWFAFAQGRKFRAKRLYEEAVEAGTEDSLTYYRYGIVLDATDEEAAARENWARAVELDPLVPEYYIAWGRSLLGETKDESWEEGKRLLQLALEIEPDNFYLERNLDSLLTRSKRRTQRAKDEAGKKDGDEDEEDEEEAGAGAD